MTHTTDTALALDLETVNTLTRAGFVAALGHTFEHSAWIVDAARAARPFASVDALHGSMMDVVRRAEASTQTAFLCMHPELAGKEAAAGTMTQDSVTEQASAGLDALSAAEVAELRGLNQRYRTRHGFPFIVAVRRFTKAQIFEQLRQRLEHDSTTELDEALAQIAAITRLRLDARLSG
jgi:2-oxo-4-hydroxy-4-carboxy-5-ureidoimidazoline decarboxylase